MQEVKYVTYYDGQPLAIFDEKEKAVSDAKECGCEWKEVNYFPTPQKASSKSNYTKCLELLKECFDVIGASELCTKPIYEKLLRHFA